MNALVQSPQTNVEAYRASTEAAALCEKIVVETAMEIQGRKYVKVEGWQAIAVAHGCAASARGVERIDGGVRAIGEIRRRSDGVVIAEAEGFVGEDEAVWFGGTAKKWRWGQARGEKVWYEEEMPKRPDYAIRAMAQTRAISRACRTAFAHVVVMMNAGLSTTPAEEVPLGGFDDRDDAPAVQNPQRHPAATSGPANRQYDADQAKPRTSINGIKRLSSAEAKRIGLDKTLKDAIWGCTTGEELVAWQQNFDLNTAQAPISWLDAVRNDIILRAEEIAGEEGPDMDLDAEFRAVIG